MSEFGMQLSRARKERGMTQEQLAEQMHVSRQTISHWETGRAVPDVETARQIALSLGCCFSLGAEGESGAKVPPAPRWRISRRHAFLTAAVLALCLTALLFWPRPKAEILVTPAAPEAYQVRRAVFDGLGWDVLFTIENVSDVAFRPEYMLAQYYQDDQLVDARRITYDEMRSWMRSDDLLKGEPLLWPFGSNQLYMTGMVCTIFGTDEHGQEMSFSGRVAYLPMEAP